MNSMSLVKIQHAKNKTIDTFISFQPSKTFVHNGVPNVYATVYCQVVKHHLHSSTPGKHFKQNVAANFNGIINLRPTMKGKSIVQTFLVNQLKRIVSINMIKLQ